MRRALVLNSSYEPLGLVSSTRAVVLVIRNKAEVLHADEGVPIRSERLMLELPTVIRLNYFVYVPYRAGTTLSRRAVFARDSYECQYCGHPAENIDHVMPRSRGGPHSWENVVASCRPCNSRKENRTPSEAGMKLATIPYAPRERSWSILAVGNVRPEWIPYLGETRASA